MWTREKNPLDELIAKGEATASLNGFQKDMLRFMHITDCAFILDAWKDSWPFCPVCGAAESKDGIIRHLDRREDAS